MEHIHVNHHTGVISSPIIISQIHNPYERRYTDEHLDEYREEYSEILTEQPPPLYLNLLDSVEDLQTIPLNQTDNIHKQKNSTTPLLQEKEEDCCSAFWRAIHSICCFFCC